MKKIAIIGVQGKGDRFATGQAVKALTIYRYFCQEYGRQQVYFANIDSAKKHPFTVMKNLVSAFQGCRNIVFMPGQNVAIFTAVVSALNKIYRRPIQYIVTGGDLAEVVKGNPRLGTQIAQFDGTHVQSKKLRDELITLGIKNAAYLPNCRDYTEAKMFDHFQQKPFRICTYSRVIKEKGILDAIEIVKIANQKYGSDVFRLEIYGKLYDAFKDELFNAINQTNGMASYEGVKKASETNEVLSQCFAILFPTYFSCECFPGTVLDAFAARIPIIANDWLYNSEVIENGVDGFIYPFRDNEKAAQLLVNLATDKEIYEKIQAGCQQSMQKFSTQQVMHAFAKNLRD